MIKKLLKELFIKIVHKTDNDRKTKNGNSIYFVEKVLEEQFGKPNFISSKTIKGYYDKYVEEKVNNAGEPSSELKNMMASYLDYDNFSDFENKNKSLKNISSGIKNNKKLFFKNLFNTSASISIFSVFIILIILTSFGIYYGSSFNNKSCLIWKNNHYEKINCDGDFQDSLLSNVDIKNFRQVIVRDTTTFFIKGQPVIWYGKSKQGKFEYFNSRGIHPITKKELKPITAYIINKYISKNKN